MKPGIKTIHLFLIKRYIPPFLATLFIAMFVFFMVFVFTYIDEIAGKGVDNSTLAELFSYSFLCFLPESMPLAVLLSSIMTFGNLGENYELASLKSAGQSLLQIMKPLIWLVAGLSVFCFFYLNNINPYIKLKNGRLLYDVRSAKPAVNIKEGIFYNGIEGYSIRVGKKEKDGITLRNVIIYDHTERKGNLIQMYADSGKLEMTHNKEYMRMTLYNGIRYQQILENTSHSISRPLMRMQFQTQIVNFDLSHMKMRKTDEELFKSNAEMMNLQQLKQSIDTVNTERKDMLKAVNHMFEETFHVNARNLATKQDSSAQLPVDIYAYYAKKTPAEKSQLIENALNIAKSSQSYIESRVEEETLENKERARYHFQWHIKFTLPVACIILFFVGAPLGAIVRKGGFGMPVIISVVLFIIYHSINFTCQKMVLQLKFHPVIGMWLGSLLFLPIGIYLSINASKDVNLLDLSGITGLWKRKKKEKTGPV